ncbi:hypothetical protein Taro_011669, partial [Colocasia esculenta]|nr:hypothetical protein [Colocasia esculenta]
MILEARDLAVYILSAQNRLKANKSLERGIPRHEKNLRNSWDILDTCRVNVNGVLAFCKIYKGRFKTEKPSSACAKESPNPFFFGSSVDLYSTPVWGVVLGCSRLTPADADRQTKSPEAGSLRFKLGSGILASISMVAYPKWASIDIAAYPWSASADVDADWPTKLTLIMQNLYHYTLKYIYIYIY